jgi:hypothetical protein
MLQGASSVILGLCLRPLSRPLLKSCLTSKVVEFVSRDLLEKTALTRTRINF